MCCRSVVEREEEEEKEEQEEEWTDLDVETDEE